MQLIFFKTPQKERELYTWPNKIDIIVSVAFSFRLCRLN